MSRRRTRKTRMKRSEKDLAAELHAHRNDPGEWGAEAVEIEVQPSRSAVVSFRLPTEEFYNLQKATDITGESLSEFIRKALSIRLRGQAVSPSVEISAGANRSAFYSQIPLARRTENPVTVPDYPPRLVGITK